MAALGFTREQIPEAAAQLAVNAADSSCGKLEAPGGFARMITEALAALTDRVVQAACGRAAIPDDATPGRVCVSAHSGGWHAAARALEHGGIPVRETYLFDALYAESDVFRDWVIANLVQDPSIAQGQYGYRRPPEGRPRVMDLTSSVQDGSVGQYGTDYYRLAAPARLRWCRRKRPRR